MKKYIKQLYLILGIIFIISGFVAAVSASNTNLNFEYDSSLEYVISSREINLKSEKLYLPEFNVRGIYVNGWAAGNPDKRNRLIKLVKNSILNTMVIDVKDTLGYLSYESKIDLARVIDANQNKIRNIEKLLVLLHNKGIYTIARIVVFKDSLLARKRPEFALSYWKPEEKKVIMSQGWVNPEQVEVWNYNISLAREALELGFDEVQFDYIRFPAMSERGSSQIILESGLTKSGIINKFTAIAREKLADLSKPVSIDVFGLTTSTDNDLGIGQNFSELSKIVNIISPMVYPSHYGPGIYGIEIPAKEPYKVINRSMVDARKKVSGQDRVILRPWLQDFSLRYDYTVRDVRQQLEAIEDLGIKEWLLWNSRSQYTEEVFLKPPL